MVHALAESGLVVPRRDTGYIEECYDGYDTWKDNGLSRTITLVFAFGMFDLCIIWKYGNIDGNIVHPGSACCMAKQKCVQMMLSGGCFGCPRWPAFDSQ